MSLYPEYAVFCCFCKVKNDESTVFILATYTFAASFLRRIYWE